MATEKPDWSKRRRFMYVVCGFIMLSIAWVLYKGLDTKPAEAAVTIGMLVLASIVGSYVFAATWDDKNFKP